MTRRVVSLATSEPVPLFKAAIEEAAGPSPDTPSLIDMARAVAAICATRVLLLLAVIFSGISLVWTIYDPTNLRIIASTAYAVVVVWPLTALFWRRG
jgi:hypothetical protein